MKWMIASDIHGSSYYCRKMLMCMEAERAERLILLGDLLYHGPRNDLPKDYAPKEVIAMLCEKKDSILCVRGNCEAEVDQMVLSFPVLAEYALLCMDGLTVFATHGHVWNPEHQPPLKEGDILLNGHTHVQALEKRGSIYYLNPGSVSIPKNGNDHSYMIYENRTFCIKNLEGKEISRITI